MHFWTFLPLKYKKRIAFCFVKAHLSAQIALTMRPWLLEVLESYIKYFGENECAAFFVCFLELVQVNKQWFVYLKKWKIWMMKWAVSDRKPTISKWFNKVKRSTNNIVLNMNSTKQNSIWFRKIIKLWQKQNKKLEKKIKYRDNKIKSQSTEINELKVTVHIYSHLLSANITRI